jgi:hypothetical protein
MLTTRRSSVSSVPGARSSCGLGSQSLCLGLCVCPKASGSDSGGWAGTMFFFLGYHDQAGGISRSGAHSYPHRPLRRRQHPHSCGRRLAQQRRLLWRQTSPFYNFPLTSTSHHHHQLRSATSPTQDEGQVPSPTPSGECGIGFQQWPTHEKTFP